MPNHRIGRRQRSFRRFALVNLIAFPIYAMAIVYVLAGLGDRATVAADPYFLPILFLAVATTAWLSLDAISRGLRADEHPPAPRSKARYAR